MDAPPPDLSESDKNVTFDQLDLTLNRMILESLLHGKVILNSWCVPFQIPLCRSIHRYHSGHLVDYMYVDFQSSPAKEAD